MSRALAVGLLLGVVLATGGCAQGSQTSASPGTPTQAPSASAPASDAPDASSLTDVACGDPRPSFTPNDDAVTRDDLVGVFPSDYLGGIANFDADVRVVGTLIGSGYLDPADRQNAAPTAWQIFRFMCRHPGVMAEGYVVSADRPDYRTTLETVYAPTVTAAVRRDAPAFCRHADQKTWRHRFECFWD